MTVIYKLPQQTVSQSFRIWNKHDRYSAKNLPSSLTHAIFQISRCASDTSDRYGAHTQYARCVRRSAIISLTSSFTAWVSLRRLQTQIRLNTAAFLSVSLLKWRTNGQRRLQKPSHGKQQCVIALPHTLSVQSLSWSSDKPRGVGLL